MRLLHFNSIARRDALVEVVFNFFQLSDEVGLIGEFFPDDMAGEDEFEGSILVIEVDELHDMMFIEEFISDGGEDFIEDKNILLWVFKEVMGDIEASLSFLEVLREDAESEGAIFIEVNAFASGGDNGAVLDGAEDFSFGVVFIFSIIAFIKIDDGDFFTGTEASDGKASAGGGFALTGAIVDMELRFDGLLLLL